MKKTYLQGILILILAVAAVNTTEIQNEDVAKSAQSMNDGTIQSANGAQQQPTISSANSVNHATSISSANASPIDNGDSDQGYTGDQYDDISARWNFVKSYSTQESSPMQMRPTLAEIQDGITEYAFSFWFKWDYLWNDEHIFDMERTNELIEIAYLSQRDNSGCADDDNKDQGEEQDVANTMGLWLDLSDDTPELVARNRGEELRFAFPNGNFDNVWTFVHFSYSTEAQETVVGVKPENAQFVVKSWKGLNPQVDEDNKLYFRLANSEDSHALSGWQGFFKEISFTYGAHQQGGYLGNTSVGLQQFWSGLSKWNPITQPTYGKVKLSEQIVGTESVSNLVIKDQLTRMVNNVNYPTEYSIGGWIQLDSNVVLDSNKRLIYRVGTKNNAIGGDSSELGDLTFQAEIDGQHVTFTTYTINDLQDVEPVNQVKIAISQDDYQNDFYIYQAYSRDAGIVIVYLQTYDQQGNGTLKTIPSNVEKITHMRSNDYLVSLGKDKYHEVAFDGVVSCLNFRYGPSSFVSEKTELDAMVKADQECVSEGDQDTDDKKQRNLESYTKKGMFISHGDPTFVTDDQVANFYIVQGLLGDPDTVSLRSALNENGTERTDFFFRHSGGLIRESRSDKSEDFNKQASWIVHKDKYIAGTVAIESANKRGFYMRRVDWIVRLVKEENDEEYKGDASWTFKDAQSKPNPPVDPKLVPVFRLKHTESEDQVLAVSEEKIGMLKQQGYEDFNQGQTNSNIVGYGWTYNRDGNASPIMEYYNPETGHHIYTTSPNDLKEGYVFNFIIVYGYKALYRGTIPIHQFNSDASKGDKHYTSLVAEITECQGKPSAFSNEYKAFWLYGKLDDPTDNAPEGPDCESNIQQCGPFIPEECEANHYRKDQESDCKICDGELKHYEGQDTNKMYTAQCTPCEGGWELINGERKCRQCPNGQWILEQGEEEKTCYPYCSAKDNMYLAFPTYKCTKCEGELQKHSEMGHIDGLNECKDCTMGTEIVKGKQVCKTCKSGWVETQMDDGTFVCIRTCPKANQYVDENDNCKTCTGGFVYDDGTTTKRCAADPTEGEGPYDYPWNEEEPFQYNVPEDQTDDVKEMAFSVWVKFQFLDPTYFNFGAWQSNDARIGGFTTDKGQVAAYLAAHGDSSEDKESFNFTGLSEAENAIQLSSRKSFDHNWILVHMSQGASQATSYVFDSKSNKSYFQKFESVAPAEFKKIQFTLGRLSGNTLEPLGFQGKFQNLEMRFAVQGLLKNSQKEVVNYLSSVGTPITTIPQSVQGLSLNKVFGGAQVDLSTQSDADKTQVFNNLGGANSYAVYGWFKLAEGEANVHTTLFNLKDKSGDAPNNEIGLVSKIGDHALETSIKGCDLQSTSYTTTANGQGGYTDVQANTVASLEAETFKRWFFVYQAYNGETNERWNYMQSIMEKEEVWQEITKGESWHLRSNQQVLTLGMKLTAASSSAVPFNGSVKGVHVKYGTPCEYKNEKCMSALFNDNKPTPDPFGQCVIMYSEPEYKGEYIYNCYENESFNMDIKSIYIPEGVEYKIWHQTQFRSLSVIYTKSQQNLDRINFELLLAQQVEGMKVVESDKYFELIGVSQNEQITSQTSEKVRVNEELREEVVEARQIEDNGIPHMVKKTHLRKQL